MRLIDADGLWSYFRKWSDPGTMQLTINLETLHEVIGSVATVRCMDCRYWSPERLDDWGGCENPDLARGEPFATLKAGRFGCAYYERKPSDRLGMTWEELSREQQRLVADDMGDWGP